MKYLKGMKKYVSKLILHKNIIKYDDPNYTGAFKQYTGMALIFTISKSHVGDNAIL